MDSRDELRAFVDKTGIPTTSTFMGLGIVPSQHPYHLNMLGMHGTVYANYAVDQADLLIALGVRFDDRVTGKLEAFATHARIIHIDIDTAEINKNKHAHIPVCADVKPALQIINKLLESENTLVDHFAPWRAEVSDQHSAHLLLQHDRMFAPDVSLAHCLGGRWRAVAGAATSHASPHASHKSDCEDICLLLPCWRALPAGGGQEAGVPHAVPPAWRPHRPRARHPGETW